MITHFFAVLWEDFSYYNKPITKGTPMRKPKSYKATAAESRNGNINATLLTFVFATLLYEDPEYFRRTPAAIAVIKDTGIRKSDLREIVINALTRAERSGLTTLPPNTRTSEYHGRAWLPIFSAIINKGTANFSLTQVVEILNAMGSTYYTIDNHPGSRSVVQTMSDYIRTGFTPQGQAKLTAIFEWVERSSDELTVGRLEQILAACEETFAQTETPAVGTAMDPSTKPQQSTMLS